MHTCMHALSHTHTPPPPPYTLIYELLYVQPLPLDRVQLCSIPSGSGKSAVSIGHNNLPENNYVAIGLENALTIVHYSRYMQIIGVYTFQTTSPAEKATWIKNIEKAQANLKDATKLIASSR